MLTKSCSEVAPRFCCNICDYFTDKKSSYYKHLSTAKHVKLTKVNTFSNKSCSKTVETTFTCKLCNKLFTSRTGLWKHNKNCNEETTTIKETNETNNEINEDETEKEILCDKELILNLLKQNAELLEIIKNGTSYNSNNIINSHNKTFNLQVFLNETCKDAMNISEFIESVKLQVSDLENVGKVGYIEGISNIIIKNLQALEVEKRPVHCTDQKREVMYVKEDNIWEKEDESNKRLRKLVRAIAHKNICMLKAFRDKYPDCEQYDSKKGSQYNKLVIEAMGGKGDNDYEKNTKIIKKIAKAVGIDKS
jgi:hypothetical protein